MRGRLALGVTWIAGLALGGCATDAPAGPATDPGQPPPSEIRGAGAFEASCAACHASRDGFDLAFFSMPDSTIVRRAVAHVDSATARDIAAHVRSLAVVGVGRTTRAFQPGGIVLGGDVEFAERLFGRDAWPEDLTSAGLLAIDPLDVAIAVPLPPWSDEATNLDWMPGRAPASVLEHDAGSVERAIDRYYARPTLDRLVLATLALRGSLREGVAGGACQRSDGPGFVDPTGCFEARRWAASLVGQHMLRAGLDDHVHPLLHGAWWDLGNVARRAGRADGRLENREENWASWMMLGWIFDSGRHVSVYTGRGLIEFAGLERHATFVALRSQVARERGTFAPYADVASAARFAPGHWAHPAVRFGLAHLVERLEAGDGPPGPRTDEALARVDRALVLAAPKVAGAELADLALLRDEIAARLR